MNNKNYDIASLILQIYNLVLLLQDFNNTDLMKELQRQDKEYLEKIVKQNEEMLQILTERR